MKYLFYKYKNIFINNINYNIKINKYNLNLRNNYNNLLNNKNIINIKQSNEKLYFLKSIVVCPITKVI